jgi:hypothetical protein
MVIPRFNFSIKISALISAQRIEVMRHEFPNQALRVYPCHLVPLLMNAKQLLQTFG